MNGNKAFHEKTCLLVLESADLLALVGDFYCIFVTFQCGILGQMWYLIVSFPDLCCLSDLKRLDVLFLVQGL